MCRNIRVLHHFEPPTTEAEMRDAALQFVRKVSGTRKPSKANQACFDRAVDEITRATRDLLAGLDARGEPRTREAEVARAKARAQRRFS